MTVSVKNAGCENDARFSGRMGREEADLEGSASEVVGTFYKTAQHKLFWGILRHRSLCHNVPNHKRTENIKGATDTGAHPQRHVRHMLTAALSHVAQMHFQCLKTLEPFFSVQAAQRLALCLLIHVDVVQVPFEQHPCRRMQHHPAFLGLRRGFV